MQSANGIATLALTYTLLASASASVLSRPRN